METKKKMNSLLKKPKIEEEEEEEEEEREEIRSRSDSDNSEQEEGFEFSSKQEQEEALVALIEHRTSEVQLLKKRVFYYQNQIVEAEKRLQDAESKLARLRCRKNEVSSKASVTNGTKSLMGLTDLWTIGSGRKTLKEEPASTSPLHLTDEAHRELRQSKPELLIPSLIPKVPKSMRSEENGNKKIRTSTGFQASLCDSNGTNAIPKVENPKGEKPKLEKSCSILDWEVVETRDRGAKRKFEQKGHDELIQIIGRSSSRTTFECHTDSLISSQHKRRLRSLVLSSVDDELFVTSALDGVVNLWQLQSDGSAASLLNTTDCVSPKQRRWPEDIAWHPCRNCLFAVYNADGGDSQISILNLNKTQGKSRLTFLEEKPHVKGIINRITFMPWQETCFTTGGSDHAVILWREGDETLWDPRILHKNLHSSAVMGVAGMQHKNIVLSSGADKRLFGFDVRQERTEFKHQLDSKCMNVLPNPRDLNLFMVQTGQLEKQLRLYDIRLPQTELHSFGWKQESSELHSALINQSWSPDGLYISSGSVDPVIHIFDIRYNANRPSQSIRSHQKRVFKAEWHSSLPLVVSISSDLNIGLHKIS